MTTYARARISNPSLYFKTPAHILRNEKFKRNEEVNVLKSMVVDADQKLEATSEGMTGSNQAFNSRELQSVLIQLEKSKAPKTVDDPQIISYRNAQLAALNPDSISSVETEIEVRRETIEQAIVDFADEFDADLIVVGSPNRSWLEALFDRSIARRVTRSASCPVLIMPGSA